MATKATGKYAALAVDRWDTLTTGVYSDSAETTNSDLMESYIDAIREILGRMIHGSESPDEYTLLCDAEERLLSRLGDEATGLAEAVETLRADRKAAAA